MPVRQPPTQGTVPVEFAGGQFVPLVSSAQAKTASLFKQTLQQGGASSQVVPVVVPGLSAGASTTITVAVPLTGGGFPDSIILSAGQSALISATATLLDQPVGLVVSAPALLPPSSGWALTGPTALGNVTATLKVLVYSPGATGGTTIHFQVTAALTGASA